MRHTVPGTAYAIHRKAIRALAQRLLDRTEWDWLQANSTGGKGISLGWYPESGFIPHNWNGYNECVAIYFLALGSQSHPVTDDAYEAWTATYPKYWRGEVMRLLDRCHLGRQIRERRGTRLKVSTRP